MNRELDGDGLKAHLTFGDVFQDVAPEKIWHWEAGYLQDGLFYPAGSVALGFFKSQQKHNRQMEEKQSVYFILDEASRAVKIGIAKDVIERLSSLQTGNPNDLEIIGVIRNAGRDTENELHTRFSEYKIKNEWFAFSDEIKEFVKCNAK